MSECLFGHYWDYDNDRCRLCGMYMKAANLRQQDIKYAIDLLRFVEVKPRIPPYVTVADCGHCFEDAGERA